MDQLLDWLEDLSKTDTKVRAVLRRSLSFPPGTYPQAFPYVEPFLGDGEYLWRQKTYYLVAGLWALNRRDEQSGAKIKIGEACAEHLNSTNSSSIERRFITLLDSDEDQLPNRLRQMVALLKDYDIDFGHLLKGLLYWNNDRKSTQYSWARDFYRTLDKSSIINSDETKEENQ